MEARKVIGFGGNSYVVSLPKSWTKRNMLKKGDLLSVRENKGEITFSKDSGKEKQELKSITIDANNKEIKLIKAEIVAAYLNNHDTIEIIANNLKDNAAVIKETIRNLSGLEIMNQTSKMIVAKDLLNINEISVKTIIRRMDTITRAMIIDTIECIGGEDISDDIALRDIDVNRLHFLAYRVIRSAFYEPNIMNSGSNPWEMLKLRYIVTKLEKIADRQKMVARNLKSCRLTNKSKEDLEKILNALNERYLNAMKSYYNKDKRLAFEIEVTNKDSVIMCEDFLINTDSSREIFSIVENMKEMNNSIRFIARAVIESD